MLVVEPSVQLIASYAAPEQVIERLGRIAYQSQDKITGDSANAFVGKIKGLGHLSVLEHSAMTMIFVCDRGVSHEIVRHRLAAYTQESTRYCRYGNQIKVICPPAIGVPAGEYGRVPNVLHEVQNVWIKAMLEAEDAYHALLSSGVTPQIARSVLPTCLKTEIGITANFREWLHIFKLRTDITAHPQMRELMKPALELAKEVAPEVFK